MTRAVIFGATSAIAVATARLWAARGWALYIVGRDAERLDSIARDLLARGASDVRTAVFEASDLASHEALVRNVWEVFGGVDIALIAHGTLSDQRACETDVQQAVAELSTNFLSVVSLLTHLANRFEVQHGGAIAVVGSVAGDRGRQSNYVYGAAKGGVATFLQGLANRLHPHGVRVLTIKPGFVDTPMTAAFRKGILWSSPAQVADGIDRAIARKNGVAYVPGWWRFVMLVIRNIPAAAFNRLKL